MLQKKYRLSGKKRLIDVKTFTAPFFLLKVSPNQLSYNRYGFVVSKRIDKRAVVRNRIKRIVRACIENLLTSIPSGYDMLFIIRKNIGDNPYEVVYATIQKMLEKEDFLS